MCWVTFIGLLQLHIPVCCFVQSHWNQGNCLIISLSCFQLSFFGNTWLEVCNRSTLCFKAFDFFNYKCGAYMFDGCSCGLRTTFRTDVDQSRNIWWSSGQDGLSSDPGSEVWTVSIISGMGGHTRAWMELIFSPFCLKTEESLYFLLCDGRHVLKTFWRSSGGTVCG